MFRLLRDRSVMTTCSQVIGQCQRALITVREERGHCYAKHSQIVYLLHCQLFRQRSAVTDTVQNAHHGGGTLPRFGDLMPTRSPTRRRRRIVVSRRQLSCRLAVEPWRIGRVLARLMAYSERAHEMMMLLTCSLADSLLEKVTPKLKFTAIDIINIIIILGSHFIFINLNYWLQPTLYLCCYLWRYIYHFFGFCEFCTKNWFICAPCLVFGIPFVVSCKYQKSSILS